MGKIVDLIYAVTDRIDKATLAGGLLSDVRQVRVGSTEAARKAGNFPLINFNLKSGDEKPVALQRRFAHKIVLTATLIDNKLSNELNRFFDKNSGKGIVYLLEKFLNVLDKGDDGSVDLTLGNAAQGYPELDYTVEEIDDLIIISFDITVTSIEFGSGDR